MKKIIRIFKLKIVWVFLIVIFTIPSFIKLVRPGFFFMQDDLQAFRVYEMDKCFADLQIPCRWVPDAGYRYGYPQFNYYPPSVYYIGEGLHLLGIEYIDTVKILFIAGYILSALAMYLLVSEIWGNFPGFVSAMLYTYAPYKATEVYVRGAMSEFWSFVFFPLIFWAVYKLVKTSKRIYIALLGLSLGMLLTTHLLMSMIFAVPAVVWSLYWLIKEKKLGKLLQVIWGVLLGVGFAAFFVIPVIFERKYAHTETLTMGYFGYLQHFVNLFKLFISREWGYGSSGFPNEKLNLSTGITQWIFGLITLGLGSFFVFIKKNNKELKKWGVLAIVLGILEVFILFMIHVKSSFIWKLLPILSWLQFPWRFLSVSVFLLALIAGLGVYLFSKYKVSVGIVVVVTAFLLTIPYFTPRNWLDITDADKFSGVSWQKQLTISIFDYLPIYAKLPPITEAPDLPEVLEGVANFQNYNKGSDYQTGKIVVLEDATIRLPLFDFPGMKVTANGTIIKHVNDNCSGEEFCLGLITFNLPKGEYEFKVELKDTPARTVGNYLSAASIITILALIFIKNEKKNTKDNK